MDEASALRESEELHRITLINMSDAVFITDDNGVFTFICPNVDVIFGYSRDEVRLMSGISELLGHDVLDREQLAASGEIRNIEHAITTKSGSRRALLVHIKQVAIKGGTVLYTCRDVTERKEFEEKLRRNEERLTLAVGAASMGIWDWDLPTGEMSWSPETHRIMGDSAIAKTPSYESFLELMHPLDRKRVAQAMTEAMDKGSSYETEFRAIGYDQVERWVMSKGKALRNGKPLRMLGVFVDLTERHRMEGELREMGGRLIQAHEEERIHISRELHDDVAQQVALLVAELGLLQKELENAPRRVRERITKLLAQAQTLGSELHRVSHELHPAILRQLGLEAAIRSFCRELSKTRQITIDVDVNCIPHPLPQDVALCVYRVAQEALHNVVRHSGASRAMVTLTATKNEVHLKVKDQGVGFDATADRNRASLGLLSMRERARMVNGQLLVQSAIGQGTSIEVRVPFL